MAWANVSVLGRWAGCAHAFFALCFAHTRAMHCTRAIVSVVDGLTMVSPDAKHALASAHRSPTLGHPQAIHTCRGDVLSSRALLCFVPPFEGTHTPAIAPRTRRRMACGQRSGVGVAALLATTGVAWIPSPPAPATGVVPPITQAETDATIAALKPPKRPRPLIAIIGVNDATETTDYLMPYSILRRADVAEVVALGTEPGPVTLYPALTIEPQATVADFEARHTEGADYVIVPAMRRDDDPAVLPWLKRQAAAGDHHRRLRLCPRSSLPPGCSTASGRRPTGYSQGATRQASHDPLRRGPAAGG